MKIKDSLLTGRYYFLRSIHKDVIQDLMRHLIFAHDGQFFYRVFGDQCDHIGIGAKTGAGDF